MGEEKGEMMIERKQTGNLWTTTIKSTASPFGGKTIIPEAINNLEIMLESDRQTKLHAKYVNPTKTRNMHININRVPGQSLHLEIVNGDRKHDLTFKVGDLNFRKMDGIFNVAVEGTSLGETVKGELKGSKNNGAQVLQFELEKGNKKYIQIDTRVKMDQIEHPKINKLKIETKTKYAVLGGKIAGKVLLKLENGELNFKKIDSTSKESIEFTAKYAEGKSLEIEGKKNGESMWTYKTNRSTKNNNKVFEMALDTDMTLSKNSMLYKFLSEKYPYGAFETRNNKVTLFVNKKNKNLLAPKFRIEVNLQKDGEKVVDLTADTTGSPYVLKLTAPNFFKRWGIEQPSIDITADHKIGRDVSLMVQKGGVQMFKITWSTE